MEHLFDWQWLKTYILRTFQSWEKEMLMVTWKNFVLSHLDYCSQLWSPYNIDLTAELETIQGGYTKKIVSIQNISYWESLKLLKRFYLERKWWYTVINVWKILEGLVTIIGIKYYCNTRTVCHWTASKIKISWKYRTR